MRITTTALLLLCMLGCASSDSIRIDLPLPPRLSLDQYDQIYLPGFMITAAPRDLKANREAINYLRQEFSNRTDMTVVEVEPVDLLDKRPREFFTRVQPFFTDMEIMARETTLAVTGVINFEAVDRSGFREVEATDRLGRTYMRSQFVEVTGYVLNISVHVYELEEGRLLYRETMRDTLEVQGGDGDVQLVYFELLGRVSNRVMGLFTSTNVKADRTLR